MIQYPDEYVELIKARIALMDQYPIFYKFMDEISLDENIACKTLYITNVDSTYHIAYNPTFTIHYSHEAKIGFLLHELLHAVLNHLSSRLPADIVSVDPATNKITYDKKKMNKWNLATDLAINCHIEHLLLGETNELIGEHPVKWELDNFQSAEWYYKLLPDSGSEYITGFDEHPWVFSGNEAIPTATASCNTNLKDLQDIIASSAGASGDTTYRLFVSLAPIIADLPKWVQSVRHHAVHGTAQKILSTRKKPNRRFGMLFPAKKVVYESNKLLVAVDISASIDEDLLKIFMKEVNKLCSYAEFDIMFFNARLQEKFRYKKNSDLVINAGGGTSFEPIMKYWNEYSKEYSALYIFTDGEAEYSTVPRRSNDVVWVIYGISENIKDGKVYVM